MHIQWEEYEHYMSRQKDLNKMFILILSARNVKHSFDDCTTLSTADLNLVMFWYIGLKCSENIAKIEDC